MTEQNELYDPDIHGPDPLDFFRPGVRPSPFDLRDHPFAAAPPIALPTRAEVSTPIRILNQGSLGSCACFTMQKLMDHAMARVGRSLDGSEQYDYLRQLGAMNLLCTGPGNGTVPRYIADTLLHEGTLTEAQWPYANDYCTKPSAAQIQAAGANKIASYANCGSLDAIKAAIASDHKVAVCLFLCKNFGQVGSDGLVPLPDGNWWGGTPDASGHAMDARDFDDNRFGGTVAIENQWGPSVAHGGIYYMPYRFFDGSIPPEQGGVWLTDTWTVEADGGVQPQPQPQPDPTPAPMSLTITGPASLAIGQTASFTLAGKGAVRPLFSVLWGDNTSTNWTANNAPTHAYTKAGDYTIQAWLGDGATGLMSPPTWMAVHVTTAPNPNPNPGPTPTDDPPISVSSVVTLKSGKTYSFH